MNAETLTMTFEAFPNTKIEKNVENGDYVIGDTLYCGQCNTPKTARRRTTDGYKQVACLCDCEARKIRKENEDRIAKEKQEKISRLKVTGFAEPRFRTYQFGEDDGSKAYKIAKAYVAQFKEMAKKNFGLMLMGKTGVGKTYLSACICNALMEQGYACLMTNLERLADDYVKAESKVGYLNSLNKYDLLVIDDYGSERQTEYMHNFAYEIIDSRYRAWKPIIVSTNLDKKELKDMRDNRERVNSRLLEMTTIVEVEHSDRRAKLCKSRDDEMFNILGVERS